VEHGDTLYVFDQAVLTAFELNSGNARWRLPSVGVVGLFFDDKDNVYVNTTSGNPDDIKYSRQIDVSRTTDAVLFKVDPKTGKTLWSIKPGGFISYLSGKFIYTVQSYDPNPADEEVMNDMIAAMQKPPYLRIARIRPADGRILWEHYQDRCPIDVRFNDNSIELIFKREVQMLRYLTF
jgi:outer membrane protein assembly factor BamB